MATVEKIEIEINFLFAKEYLRWLYSNHYIEFRMNKRVIEKFGDACPIDHMDNLFENFLKEKGL